MEAVLFALPHRFNLSVITIRMESMVIKLSWQQKRYI